jgi:hypothetical protein
MEDTPHPPRSRKAARALTAALLIPALALFAPAAPPAPTNATSASWQTQATAAQLTPAHIEQLARDKLLIGPQTHRQIFQPYIAAGMEKTRFITSDAALAAYHALFEDSFRELELRRAYILRRHLETLFKQTRGKPPELSPAQEFIQQLLGPALVTLGAPLTNFDEKLRPEIKKQAALIRAATDVSLPEWLGPPSRDLESLDYRRCKPVSFYAGQPALKNYFRAMRWLQLVPLRADRNNELTAWALLAHVVNDQENPRLELGDFFSSLSLFVGPEADQGLSIPNEGLRWTARMVANSADYPSSQQDALIDLRAALLEAHADSPLRSINDELRQNLHNTSNNARLATIRFRIAPTFALPDAELISQSLDAQIRPNGLMIAALLGSTFAEERMPQVPADDWAKWKKSARALTLSQDGAPRSLYADYFDTLRALNAPPVENAPAFMRSSAWQAKTVQTQLASWAQARHTYALQAKLSIMYFGSIHYSRPPPGFVEPNPSFWREYNHLVERTTSLLKAGGVFTPSPFLMAFELRKAAAQIERRGLHREEASLTTLENDDFHTGTIRETITRLGNKSLLASSHYTSDEEMRIDYRDAIAFLKDIADKTERGEFSPVDLSPSGHPTLAARWESLETLSRQLETILAKQLDETELNHLERMVLIHFGNKLARTMGYFHFAERDVRDDAPRWAEVAHITDDDQSLGIGTSRAQTIHVLYPWHGEELLCIGAMLPYFEEWAPTKRLTDDEWRQKLDSPAAPPPPTWIQPLLAR